MVAKIGAIDYLQKQAGFDPAAQQYLRQQTHKLYKISTISKSIEALAMSNHGPISLNDIAKLMRDVDTEAGHSSSSMNVATDYSPKDVGRGNMSDLYV